MNEEYQNNVATTLREVEARIMHDLGMSSGVNPAKAQAFGTLHASFMSAVLSSGRGPSPLDPYVLGILDGMATLLTTDMRDGATAFDRIAAQAIGGAAHVRTALDGEKAAQDAEKAAKDAQAAGTVAQAAPPATEDPAFVKLSQENASLREDLARTAKALNSVANAAKVPMPPVGNFPAAVLGGSGGALLGANAGPDPLKGTPAPQDPREASPGAYEDTGHEV